MKDLLNALQSESHVKKQPPLEVENVITAQKELCRKGYPLLPKEFLEFLKIYNGVQTSDSAILGIQPENKDLDIVGFNKIHNLSQRYVILGYDEFCFLVYDIEEKEYFLIDRENGDVMDDFLENELESALFSIIHIDDD